MKSALVIVNGIVFPFYLSDYAIAWAKQEGGSLHVLFIVSGEEMPEGYVFPSDIDLAETLRNKSDAEKDSRIILLHQEELFTKMAETEKIPCQTEVLVDPTPEQVLEKAKQAALLIVAPEYGDAALQALSLATFQRLIEQSPIPVKMVAGEARSDD